METLKKILPRSWQLKAKICASSAILVFLAILLSYVVIDRWGDQGQWVYWINAIVLTGLAMGWSYFMGYRISSSINYLIDSVQNMKIIEGKNSHLARHFQDELGTLSREIVTILERLKEENLHNVKLITGISQAVERLSQYSGNILTISHEQATGASQQATAIQEAFTTSKEIAVTSKEIANNALSVTQVADNANVACQDGNERVDTAIGGMDEVKLQVSSLADKMLDLGKSNQKIGKVVDIIDEISERTNLLALNAAIEAAGAGSAGKRFGIVASEIRRLAEKTVEATLQIKTLINAMQEVTNSTIMSTEQSIHAVGESFNLVQNVGSALQNISDLVQRTSKAAKEISFSTQQQTSASEQMSVAIAEVNQVAEHFVRGSEETAQAIEELNDLTKNLKEQVSQNGT